MTYLRVNLRYGTDWYPSPVLSFMVDPCTGGTVVPAPPPSGTAPSSADLESLESRVTRLENCLRRYAPYLCSSRLDDIEDSLKDLERGW